MIDTDKYEGHTPAPWLHNMCYENGIIVAGETEKEEKRITVVQSKHLDPTPADDYDDISFEEAVRNIHLIADAPLLLAEVKRLREENKRYRNRLLETHSWSELRALEEEEE
tara:strand:+ start:595 stop:927 length:333 start_codon:yes stop_codon:yes gene_type:complete